MTRFEEPTEGEWVQPVRRGYKMVCCDCGRVHKLDFRIYRGRVQFRVWDAPRSTGQIRRHMDAQEVVQAVRAATSRVKTNHSLEVEEWR